MTAEKKQFVLYEYLMFFWKKKWFFLLFPIIFMLLGALVSQFVLKDDPYTGKATIYTGAITSKGLTDPVNVESKYADQLENPLSASVPQNNYVSIKITGTDRDSIEKDLDTVTTGIMKDLTGQYEIRYDITDTYIKSLEERVTALEEQSEKYNDLLVNDGNLTVEEIDYYTQVLIDTDEELTEVMSTLQRIKGDLAFFEAPSLASSNVGAADTYLKESLAIGVILGLLFALGFLMLWKYLFDAKRHYSHN
ncbi:Wzz/FepE/Etk N-terminal domain-containing protein [Fredinandcohnia humi]